MTVLIAAIVLVAWLVLWLRGDDPPPPEWWGDGPDDWP